MAKKCRGKFSNVFRQCAVARLKQCDNIVEVTKKLGVQRRLSYAWRDQLPVNSSERDKILLRIPWQRLL